MELGPEDTEALYTICHFRSVSDIGYNSIIVHQKCDMMKQNDLCGPLLTLDQEIYFTNT